MKNCSLKTQFLLQKEEREKIECEWYVCIVSVIYV